MRDGLRYALMVVAGLLGVLLVISFTAWGLTTYGSIRHIVGDIAAMPDKAVALQGQFDDMAVAFSGGSDAYTFRFNAAPIAVSKSQADGLGREEVIGLVLDTYTSDLYNGRLTAGSPGPAGVLFNATGNLIYLAITLIIAIAFIAIAAGAVLPYPDPSMPGRLKSAGKIIAAICLMVFLIFAFIPGVVKSVAWGYIGNHDAARDVLDILEPALVGSLLRNTVLMTALGGIVYGAGVYLERQDGGQARRKPARATPLRKSYRERHIRHAEQHRRRGL